MALIVYDGERCIPAAMSPADPVLAEHLMRYEFAAARLRANVPADGWVLDVPSGAGYGTRMLTDANPGLTAVGMDIDPGAVDYATGAYANIRTTFEVASMEDPTAGGFDAVVCFEGIEHVDNQPRVAAKLVGALKPGGLLIVSTPRRGGPGAGSAWHTHEMDLDELVGLFAPYLSSYEVLDQERRVGDRPAEGARYFVLVGRTTEDDGE